MTFHRTPTGIIHRAGPSEQLKRKPRAKPRDIEGPVQRAIIEALEWAVDGIDVRAVPNGGKRGKRVAAQLKRDGVVKGTLDLLIAWPGCGAAGIGVMEIKPPGYSPSDITTEQRDLIDRWSSWGLHAGIASTIDEAINLMRAWGATVRVRVAA